jgi:hypothetical protein
VGRIKLKGAVKCAVYVTVIGNVRLHYAYEKKAYGIPWKPVVDPPFMWGRPPGAK